MATGRRGTSGGHKQPYHHGDLRSALMAAALRLINKHGVKGFSLKDAATDAGVSTAAPYRHFADKEALLGAIQDEGFSLFNASLAAAYAKADTAQSKIVALGVAYVRFALEHPAHFRLMFSMSGDKASSAEMGNSGFLLLVEAVDRLHPDAQPEWRKDLVVVCWSVVHGYAVLFLDGALTVTTGIDDPEEHLRRSLTLLVGRDSEK